MKISKAFSRIELEEENSDIEEETDEMTALFAKHIKRNFNKGKFRKSFQKKDVKDYSCFNCNEKGHLAKSCPKASSSPKNEGQHYKKKALIAAWGDESDEELDLNKFQEGACLMAIGDNADSDNSEVSLDDFLSSLSDCSHKQLIKVIKILGKENSTLQEKLTDNEDLFACITAENQVWSKKFEESEKELLHVKDTLAEYELLHAKAFKELWGDAKLESIMSNLPINANLPESAHFDPEEYAQVSLQKIMDKLDCIQDSINAKTINQTVFLGKGMALDFLRKGTQMYLIRLRLRN